MAAIDWMRWAVTADAELRVQAAMNYIAINVVNEDTSTPNHDQRMTAARVLLNGQINIPDFTKLVCADSEVRASIESTGDVTDPVLLDAVQRSLVIMAKVLL